MINLSTKNLGSYCGYIINDYSYELPWPPPLKFDKISNDFNNFFWTYILLLPLTIYFIIITNAICIISGMIVLGVVSVVENITGTDLKKDDLSHIYKDLRYVGTFPFVFPVLFVLFLPPLIGCIIMAVFCLIYQLTDLIYVIIKNLINIIWETIKYLISEIGNGAIYLIITAGQAFRYVITEIWEAIRNFYD